MKKNFSFDTTNLTRSYTKKNGIFALLLIFIDFFYLFLLNRTGFFSRLIEKMLDIIKKIGPKIMHRGLTSPETFDFLQIIILLQRIALVIVLLIIIRENIQSIGFRFKKMLPSFLIAMLISLSLLVVNMGLSLLFAPNGNGRLKIQPVKFSGLTMVKWIIISIYEEIFYRGYTQTRIFGLIKNKYMAIVVIQLFFVLIHFVPNGWTNYFLPYQILHIIVIFFTGIGYAFAYLKTGNLWGCIAAHTIYNILTQMFYVYFW